MRASVLITLLILASLGDAAAQDPLRPRSGVWFGVGGSIGFLSGTFPQHDDQQLGGSFNIGFGTAIVSQLRVAAELDALFIGDGGLATLALVGSVYPSATGNLFLKAGAGYRGLFFTCAEHSAQDIALLVGLGFDIRRGNSFSLTPFAQLALHVSELDSQLGTQMGTGVQGGLSLTWH